MILYGSSVADTTLTTACKMASASGGTETSKTTTTTTGGGGGFYAEVLSQGGTFASVTSIPTPDGKGWIFFPGAGTFATGNWSASCTVTTNSTTTNLTIRFYKYSSGTYTSIGSIVATVSSGSKTTYSFAATSMSTFTTGASDGIYTDLWYQDTTGIGGDNPIVFVSTSATAGVTGDMQVTTSTFTAGGKLRIFDGLGGLFQ